MLVVQTKRRKSFLYDYTDLSNFFWIKAVSQHGLLTIDFPLESFIVKPSYKHNTVQVPGSGILGLQFRPCRISQRALKSPDSWNIWKQLQIWNWRRHLLVKIIQTLVKPAAPVKLWFEATQNWVWIFTLLFIGYMTLDVT